MDVIAHILKSIPKLENVKGQKPTLIKSLFNLFGVSE